MEEIIKTGPDIVLSSGTDEMSISQAEELEAKLGIPVVLIDSDFDKMADSYRYLGELLGDVERGEALATYTEDTLNNAKEITETIPDEEKVTVYYAEEQLGLNTDPSGSEHSRLIDICGGINVADCEIKSGYGRTEVSMEQVIAWNPEYIICSIDNGYADSGSYNTIIKDSQWSVIQAVKDGNVFETPTLPLNWFDRPPSVNTIIGVKWVQAILYPELVDYDIREEAKEFYSLFYHYELEEDELDILLANALGV
ncbi:MAG: ABC transporter substrate-binding protein [Lachnospirales bacterium]